MKPKARVNMVNLGTFAYAEMQRIARFESWWNGMHEQEPDNYPMFLLDSEWEEQYKCWQEEV